VRAKHSAPPPADKIPRVIRAAKLALLVVSCLVGLGVTELLLRARGYTYSPLQIGASNGSDFREEHAFRDRNLVYDATLIWRPLSSQFSPFNPQGFRGAPIDPVKSPGSLRVIALGDSNTFGWAVDDGANWPAQLEGLLAERRPGARVVNAGVWGYTLFQGRRRFDEILAFSPDVVLVSFGANDAHQVAVPDAEYVRSHDRIAEVARLTSQLRVAQLGVAAWDQLVAQVKGGGVLGPRVPLADYTAYLREIVGIARTRGIAVVLLTRPFVGASTDPESWKTHAPTYNQATRDVGAAEHVPVIDVYGAFHDKPGLFDDESHFGVEGHRRMAELVATRLLELMRH
jgi:lysophospholipase L1-like esterase